MFLIIFTDIFFFLIVIGVVYLILSHYAKGNLFLSRNGFKAPITRKWQKSGSPLFLILLQIQPFIYLIIYICTYNANVIMDIYLFIYQYLIYLYDYLSYLGKTIVCISKNYLSICQSINLFICFSI